MKHLLSYAITSLVSCTAFAQYNATITVTSVGTGSPLENATVQLDGNSLTTDAAGQAIFTGLVDGTFEYSVSAACHASGIGSVTIAGADATSGLALDPATANSVFFFIGSPFALLGATVELSDGADYYQTFVTWSTWGGESLENVPYGEYTYTITTPCYETVTGNVTVGCNNGEGVAVFAEPAETTANSVFFFIGSPFALLGATVELSDGADYYESFVTWSTWGGESLENVPYGEYTYTITTPCYETVTGNVTVGCNNGEGVAVFAEPAETTANSVFFFIGSPFALLGATVELSDGADYYESFVTWSTWGGESLENVPYGEYTYTITTPCYETVTGNVTVGCNNGEGVAVFAEPAEISIDLTVTLDGSVLTAAASGMEYQWVDCDNGNAPIDGANAQSFAPTQNGNYAVIITSGDCSQTSTCTAVTTTGTEDIEAKADFSVYPNPFSEVFTVRTDTKAGTVRVELFTADGRMVLDETHSGLEQISVQTTQLPAGSYLLRLTTGNAIATRNVVVSHQ